jgi:hypothetical protein
MDSKFLTVDKERFFETDWYCTPPATYYIVECGFGHVECGKVVNFQIKLFAKMLEDGTNVVLPGPPIQPGWINMDSHFDWKSYYYGNLNVQEISEAKFNCIMALL